MTEQDGIAQPMTDREFNSLVAKRRMSTGMAAEMRVAADLFSRGYTVAKPLDGIQKYDLIIDKEGTLLKVQVKSSTGKYPQGAIGWTVYKEDIYNGKGVTQHVVRKYNKGDFDILAIYHVLTGIVYYVPIADLDLTKASFSVKMADRDKYSDP